MGRSKPITLGAAVLAIDYTTVEPRLAYARLGDDDRRTSIYLPGLFIPVATMDDDPGCARFLDGLASIGQLIVFDRRGLGYADPITDWETPICDQWADDLEHLLDELEIDVCSVISSMSASAVVTRVARRRPDAFDRLVFIHGTARTPESIAQESEETIRAGRENQHDWPRRMAPSRGDDPAFRSWWERSGQQGASPGVASRIWPSVFAEDIRDQLPAIDVPSLVVHRPANHVAPAALCQELADGLARGEVVELVGEDALEFAGDIDELVSVITDFLGGATPTVRGNQRLAAILMTDVVGSTVIAQRAGPENWRGMLDHHDRIVGRVVNGTAGDVVKFTGDGALATFASSSQALRAAHRLIDELAAAGLPIRAGVHVGEIGNRGADVAGLAVHIAARVMGLADAGEVLCSSSVAVSAVEAGLRFETSGSHTLRGVEGTWEIYRSIPC